MSVSLVKGQKISLSKEMPGLNEVVVGLGWDAAKRLFGSNIDCDASAIVLGTNNSYRGVAYYGERNPDRGESERTGGKHLYRRCADGIYRGKICRDDKIPDGGKGG